MTKNEFIIEAVLALNKGNSRFDCERVGVALLQYHQLVDAGIEFDEQPKK